MLAARSSVRVNGIVTLTGLSCAVIWLGCVLVPKTGGQGMMEYADKVKVAFSKGRTAMRVAAKFLPCFKLVSEIQDNMKKVGYNSKGLKLCFEKAIPKDEEILGRENQEITKEEIRDKVKSCITSMIAVARGKDDVEDDMLADVKECFMNAAQSLSSFAGDSEREGEAGGERETR